jgi:hypothetical protein
MPNFTPLVEVVEGWTDPLEFQLVAIDPVSSADIVLNLVGRDFTLILAGNDKTLVDVSGKLQAADALTGKVKFFPDQTDLKASLSPYRARWKITDSGKDYFLPNGPADYWDVYPVTEQ